MADKKEPMISQQNRPTAVDFDMPISDFKLRDLHAVINSHLTEKEIKPEQLKPEQFKPEHIKPEKELLKVEKELIKPEKEIIKAEKEKEAHKTEKEFFKPEKEFLKPEKELQKPELTKPEKTVDPGLVEQIATRVAEKLKTK